MKVRLVVDVKQDSRSVDVQITEPICTSMPLLPVFPNEKRYIVVFHVPHPTDEDGTVCIVNAYDAATDGPEPEEENEP